MTLIDPNDSLERQNEKLVKIAEALMRRVEHDGGGSNEAYAQFERAALLEKMVRERTLDLERTLNLLHDSNAQLAKAHRDTETARRNLADAIETVREGFALFDPEGILVMFNSRVCRLFRDTVTQLSPGLPFDDYIAKVSRSRYMALPKGETPQSWAARRIRRHQDRHVMFNVELTNDRWLQVSEHRTANGGTVVLQTDVTDLIRLERQEQTRLKDKQARMIRATLDHLNQGVCIFDENARLVGWNKKIGVLLGIPATRLRLGASFEGLLESMVSQLEFTTGVNRSQFMHWSREQNRRPPISFEVRRNDRETLHIFGRGMPDHGFVISCTDVTAEREAARQLHELNEILEQRVMERTLELEDALNAAERANASKSRFVAAASHDLLQPLTAAKLFVSSLADRNECTESAEVLAKTESALVSAEKIIDALLDISKLDSDGLSFDIGTVALRDILSTLRDEMGVLAARKGLKLTIIDSSLIVTTDAGYLRRVLQNLLANAIRYTDQGRVVVGVRRVGDTARVEVWDTGAGIAEEDQGAIFEEFRRLDAGASANDGLGLGLAIVERACARLGHPLGLWSEPGVGSCFMVNLPIAGRSDASLPAERRLSGPLRLAQTGMIVLLVENEPQLRRAMSLLLESWGIHVIEAPNGEEALELLEDLDLVPDALLFDYQLGQGQTGTELYENIRKIMGPLPCAIASADRSPALRETCQRLEIPLFLKPLDRRELGQFLNNVALSQNDD